jgi:hypothetical protein
MKHSRLSQENRNSTTGLGRGGLDHFQTPHQPGEQPGNGVWNVTDKTPLQPVSQRFPALERQEVTLTFFAPEAGEVNVAGNFNGWRPEATKLKYTGAGEWLLRLMLRSGQYEYRFVVDGLWREDPRASKRVADPYGGFNSVLMVPLAVKTSIL